MINDAIRLWASIVVLAHESEHGMFAALDRFGPAAVNDARRVYRAAWYNGQMEAWIDRYCDYIERTGNQ